MSDDDCNTIEEHHLPGTDAVLAATLALMTGYSQALQADLHPRQRLAMGEKIVLNLALLSDRPALSRGLCEVLRSLQRCWLAMSACTRDAAGDVCGACGDCSDECCSGGSGDGGSTGARRLH